MHGDADLRSLEKQLNAVSQDEEQHHGNLQNLLEQFRALMESYHLLRSDYEEEREGREKYKRLAKGQVSTGWQKKKQSGSYQLHLVTEIWLQKRETG